MRQPSARIIYTASSLAAGTYNGSPVQCNDVQASALHIGFKLVTSAANFVGTVGFAGSIADDGDYTNWPLLTFGLDVSLKPAQITLPTVSTTGAILTFATGLAAGTYQGLLRFATPPPVVVPRFTFTSGGGTYTLQIKAVY